MTFFQVLCNYITNVEQVPLLVLLARGMRNEFEMLQCD